MKYEGYVATVQYQMSQEEGESIFDLASSLYSAFHDGLMEGPHGENVMVLLKMLDGKIINVDVTESIDMIALSIRLGIAQIPTMYD